MHISSYLSLLFLSSIAQAAQNGFVTRVRPTTGQPTLQPRAASPGKDDMPTELSDFSPKPPRGNLRTFNFQPSCSTAQREKITKHFQEALVIIDNVVKTATKDSVPYKTFMDFHQAGQGAEQLNNDGDIGGSSFPAVMKVFEQMKELITTNDKDLKVTCGKADGGCEIDTMAWADKTGLQINFCPNFFYTRFLSAVRDFADPPDFGDLKCKDNGADGLTLDLAAAGIKSGQIDMLAWMPAQTVVHELSHLFMANSVVKITDCYYGAFAAEYMATHLPDAALGNADNYAWFATTQYLNTLCGEPDQVIYRATWDNKHLIIDDSFQAQYIAFEKKKTTKNSAKKAFAEAKSKLNKARNQIIEEAAQSGQEVAEDGFPIKMTTKQAERVRAVDKEAAAAYEALNAAKKLLDDFDQNLCDMNASWEDIMNTMNKRNSHPV